MDYQLIQIGIMIVIVVAGSFSLIFAVFAFFMNFLFSFRLKPIEKEVAKISKLEQRMDKLEAGQTKLETDISTLKAGQAKLEGDIKELKQLILNFQK